MAGLDYNTGFGLTLKGKVAVDAVVELPPDEDHLAVVGLGERHLKMIREGFGVSMSARSGKIRIQGDPLQVKQANHVLDQIRELARKNRPIERQRVLDMIAAAGHQMKSSADPDAVPTLGGLTGFDVYARGRRIKALTNGQRDYLNAIATHDLTFCTGPAGTGKTYLAVAAAAHMLKSEQVRRLVLVRPAVEAGERLGFLPGDMQQKVNPYLRPLMDALHDMMDYEQIQRLLACDVIEMIPLAFMRGRTLNDSVIILDEGQNTTASQMMMFLTRLGHGSKMIVTGDTTQIDLDKPNDSGLIDAVHKLRRVSGVALVALSGTDIVRHNLVQRIVEAYGNSREKKENSQSLDQT